MYMPSILVYKYININNDFFKYRVKHQLIFITASFLIPFSFLFEIIFSTKFSFILFHLFIVVATDKVCTSNIYRRESAVL